MQPGIDYLFELLPAVVREADAKRGHPLRDLLRVISEQAGVLQQDIRRMYENLFIETCEPWVIPYIGDLVGYKPLFVSPNADSEGHGTTNIRRAVASRVGLNRRKGTFSVLDDLVAQTTGWSVRVGDDRGGDLTVNLHVWRQPSWPLTRVRPFYQPRRVNCFSLSVLGNDAPVFTRADPEPVGEDDTDDRAVPQRITRDMLRRDLEPLEPVRGRYYGPDKSLCLYENGHPVSAERLVVRDLAGWDADIVDNEVAIDPVRGRVMLPERRRPKSLTASYYQGFATAMGGGEYPRPRQNATAGMSLFREGHLVEQGVPFLRALRSSMLPISEWIRGKMDKTVLNMSLDDPVEAERRLSAELNRILQAYTLPDDLLNPDLAMDAETASLRAMNPQGDRRIRLNRLLLEAVYPETIRRSFGRVTVSSRRGMPVIMDAVRELQESPRPPMTMVIELTDSGLYVEPVVVNLRPFHTLILRADEGCRPTIMLPERDDDIDDMVVSCGHASRVVLDGLMVARRAVRISGNPRDVTIRHCTFVPGWELDQNCNPVWGSEPSLILSDIPIYQPWEKEGWTDCPPELLVPTRIRIDRSITGTIIVQRDEVDAEPVRLDICRSIVDATAKDTPAIGGPGDWRAHAVVSIVTSTILGTVKTHMIELGENSIFTGTVDAARRQLGCIRYCYLPPSSRTPKRHACQPDLVMRQAQETGGNADGEAARIVPKFLDQRLLYGRPNYCRLDDIKGCANEILQGADDESEMGAFHDLFVPQRLANLHTAIADFLPLGWIHKVNLES